MKTGYDDFFKSARKSAASGHKPPPRASVAAPPPTSPRKPEGRHLTVTQVEELRARLKNSKKSKKRRSLPKSLVAGTIVGFALAVAAFFHHEDIDTLLGRLEVSAMPSARANEAAAERKPAAVDPKAADAEKAKAAAPDKKASELSADEINHLQKLVERKDELDAREEELRRLETELAAQKTEIEKKMKSLEDTRTGITGVLAERSNQDQAKVDSLVQMYSTMKPGQAAKVLESMDEDLAVEIIGRMKKKNAAEVLNLMKPEKAQVFSEKYAGYRKR